MYIAAKVLVDQLYRVVDCVIKARKYEIGVKYGEVLHFAQA